MKLKTGVDVRFLRHEFVRVLPNIDGIFHHRAPGVDFVITAGLDGTHRHNSKHYKNAAIDVRRRDLTADQLPLVVEDLQKLLGDDFDIVIEPTHIHIELDI